MDDKLFELVEKMYSEMNQRFDNMEEEIRTVGQEIDGILEEFLEKFDYRLQ